MGLGRVVITTRTEAPSDLVVEVEVDLYTQPGDARGVRGRIMTLLNDPAVRGR